MGAFSLVLTASPTGQFQLKARELLFPGQLPAGDLILGWRLANEAVALGVDTRGQLATWRRLHCGRRDNLWFPVLGYAGGVIFEAVGGWRVAQLVT